MLHFTRNIDDRSLAIRDWGPVEQSHQLWHEPLSEHCPGLEQRSQILDELTGERVVDDRHSRGSHGAPIGLTPSSENTVSRVVMSLRISTTISFLLLTPFMAM